MINLKDKVKHLAGSITNVSEKVMNGVGEAVVKATNLPKDINYISKKNKEIKTIIKETHTKSDPIRQETNKKLEELGKVRIDIMSTVFEEFNTHMKEIKNLPFDNSVHSSLGANNFSISQKEFNDMQVSVLSIKEILKNTTKAGVAGAISAGAAYSAVAAFGAATTGSFISTISGIAASNATLAWIGGGVLSLGSGGIAFGAVILSGIAIVPAVSYLIWKGKFNYADERIEVDEHYREAILYKESIDKIIKNLAEMIKLIENTIVLTRRYSVECNKLNKQTDHIIHQIGDNYAAYTKKQKALIQKHIIFFTGLYALINTPIMNEDGTANSEMMSVLKTSNQFLNEADEIVFVSYKKKVSTWIIVVPIIIVLGIACYFYYQYFYTSAT